MTHLNQIIAVEKGIKQRAYNTVSDLHKVSKKVDSFNGFTKSYQKKDEEGEEYPQEKKKVIYSTAKQMELFSIALTEMFDITATKDYANCKAIADIIIDGKVIAKDVPAPFLLYMEKQINDIRTFVEALPVLDESEDWTYDVNSGQYKTEPTITHKSKKVQKPIILAEATKEHPAQTQLISDDILVGYWNTIKYSGAIPIPVKQEVLMRIEKLSTATKCAREKANSVEAQQINIGNDIFNYIFVSQA